MAALLISKWDVMSAGLSSLPQVVKPKDPAPARESKVAPVLGVTVESSAGTSRQKRQQDHEKERKELFSKPIQQVWRAPDNQTHCLSPIVLQHITGMT